MRLNQTKINKFYLITSELTQWNNAVVKITKASEQNRKSVQLDVISTSHGLVELGPTVISIDSVIGEHGIYTEITQEKDPERFL